MVNSRIKNITAIIVVHHSEKHFTGLTFLTCECASVPQHSSEGGHSSVWSLTAETQKIWLPNHITGSIR